ncbi:hypothetical protein ACFY0N_00265 [Streptomyces vinaceus]|uniref:hypothetical protein n=1 Tax=Streptomyces vinaceus TaxID=1960 RepID=UPI0036940C69
MTPAAFELPAPEFPRGPGNPLGGLVARYRCTAGCGWYHDEPADRPASTPLRIPMGSDAETSASLTERAEQGLREHRQRAMHALTQHMLAEHQDPSMQVIGEVVPRPKAEFPYLPGDPRHSVARFRCPQGCDWACYVDTNLGAPTMLAAPGEELSQAQVDLIRRNEEMVAAFWATVEGAIAEHVADAHPEIQGDVGSPG